MSGSSATRPIRLSLSPISVSRCCDAAVSGYGSALPLFVSRTQALPKFAPAKSRVSATSGAYPLKTVRFSFYCRAVTNARDKLEEKSGPEDATACDDATQGSPVWLRASLVDLANLDFEAPIRGSPSADSNGLGERFRASAESAATDAASETPAARIFSMLAAVNGMHLKAQDPNEPFGPMVVWAEGRRSAAPGDFRGEPVAVLAEMAARAEHPVLRARLADVCWLVERKRAQLGKTAISAYVEIVKRVDGGALRFRFDNEPSALKHEARDLLRRALSIARAIGLDQTAASAPRALAADLRLRAFESKLPVPALWFGHLDLDCGISNPAEVGRGVEALIAAPARGHRRPHYHQPLADGVARLSSG